MPMLMATNQMMKLAAQDAPQKHTFQTYWGSTYTVTSRKYRLFLRCKIEGNILRVSLISRTVCDWAHGGRLMKLS